MNHAIIQCKRFFYRQSIKSFIHQMAVHKGDLGGSNKVRITNFYFTLSFLIPKGSYLVVNGFTCNNNNIRIVKD